MARYRYTATDSQGRVISGMVTADSHRALVDRLAGKGYTITAVEEFTPTRTVFSPFGRVRGRLSVYALAPYFRSFYVLYRSGVPISAALESLARQARGTRMRQVATAVHRDVVAGAPLTAAMERHEPAFSPLELALIRSGEEGGYLERALQLIAEYLEEEIEIRRLLILALAYPVLLIAAAVMIPLLTNLLARSWLGADVAIWGPLNSNTFWIGLGVTVLVLIIGFRLAMNYVGFRVAWDEFRLRIPFLGKTAHMLIMARFGHALAALYRSGMTLSRSLRLSGQVSGSELVHQRCLAAAVKIEGGAGITDTLIETRVFHPLVIDMVRTGETTGNLDEMLTKASEFMTEDAKMRARIAGIAFGVLVLVMIALYVAFFVIRFYTGYFGGILEQAE